MYKIRRIQFIDHNVLGNLELDFTDKNGYAADTIIFAGENGMGKSEVMKAIFNITSKKTTCDLIITIEDDGKLITLRYVNEIFNGSRICKVYDDTGKTYFYGGAINDLYQKYPFKGIYSDVDINFSSSNISTVTSMVLDSATESRCSSNEMPKQIKQLIIDIQASDDSTISSSVQENPNKTFSELNLDLRITRFTRSFNRMFDKLEYSGVRNENGHKAIVFKKFGKDISIDKLSSGEKQIVYRGCFLLKDVNAMNGAFVFIDEPEISLHPSWQMKIMEYYKGIFTNEQGVQTSQIFAVTHSPFVIHNDNRKNDKVIILARDENGKIIVKDKPEYYKCNSIEAVQDAFSIRDFSLEKPAVYLEGRTDEKYFKRATEVYGYVDLPFEFKWIGYMDERGQEANTGKDALNKAVPFLTSRCLSTKNVCLYDCDTNKPQKEENNVITISIPKFDNDRNISIGIENALVFGDVDIEEYRKQKVEYDGYGIEKRIPDFRKMECCDFICSLDNERLKQIFVNLKTEIDMLISLFGDN